MSTVGLIQAQDSQDNPNIVKIKLDDISRIMFIPANKSSSLADRVATRWCIQQGGNR